MQFIVVKTEKFVTITYQADDEDKELAVGAEAGVTDRSVEIFGLGDMSPVPKKILFFTGSGLITSALIFLGADLLLFMSSSNSAIRLEDAALLASNSMPVDLMAEYTSLASAAYSSSGIMDLRATKALKKMKVHFNLYENHVKTVYK